MKAALSTARNIQRLLRAVRQATFVKTIRAILTVRKSPLSVQIMIVTMNPALHQRLARIHHNSPAEVVTLMM
ncbi:hypothetical protein D3C87_1677070 [compost metagenome]